MMARSGILAAALAGFMLLGPAPQPSEAQTFVGWFHLGAGTERDWRVSSDKNDAFKLLIEPAAPRATLPRKRVFVLYPRASTAYDTAMTRILSLFGGRNQAVEFTVVNFNRNGERAKAALAQAIRHNADLIVSMGSESTAWLWKNYRGGAIPVVSVCSKDPVLLGQAESYAAGSGSNFALTSLDMPVNVQLAYIRKFNLNLKNVAILADRDNVSVMRTQVEPLVKVLAMEGLGAHVVALRKTSNLGQDLAAGMARALKAMRQTDPDLSASVFWITGSTMLFSQLGAIDAQAGTIPVLSSVTDVVRQGSDSAIMAIGVSFESNAHLAALYMLDILNGRRSAQHMPVGVVNEPDIAISFLKAKEKAIAIPFALFETATRIYGYDGNLVRKANAAADDR